MNHPYKHHLTTFLETITEFKHTSNRLNKALLKDAEKTRYKSQHIGFM